MGDGSVGVVLPKDDLRMEGLVDEDGEIVERPNFFVKYEGPGTFEVERLDGEVPKQPDTE